MKKVLNKMIGFALGALMLAPVVASASPEPDCDKCYNNWAIRMNQNDYAGAYPFWQCMLAGAGEELTSCKHFNDENIALANYMFAMLIRPEADAERKRVLIDSNYMTYEWREKYFSKDWDDTKRGDFLMRWGIDEMTYDYEPKRHESFKHLGESIKLYPTQYAIQGYFRHAYNKLRYKDEGADCDFLVKEYFYCSEIVQKLKDNGGDAAQLDPIQAEMDKMAEFCLSCEQLVPMVAKIVAEMPEDCEAAAPIIKKYITLLDSKGCQESEPYAKLAMKQYECNKSADAAYAIAYKYNTEGKSGEAMKFLKEAIELGKSEGVASSEMGKFYMLGAKISKKQGNLAGAKSYGEKAANSGKQDGWRYVGDYYASNSTCGSTGIERKSVWWLADDYYEKAGLGKDRNKAKYPKRADLFNATIQVGSSYNVPCWNMKTTVRARD